MVTNINDNEPYFISSPYTFTIPEDIETNVLIGRVVADDVDHDNLIFSVTGSGKLQILFVVTLFAACFSFSFLA